MAEDRVIVCVFECLNDGFGRQPMTHGILTRFSLALFGNWSGAETCIAAVGFNLSSESSGSLLQIGFVSLFCLLGAASFLLNQCGVGGDLGRAPECHCFDRTGSSIGFGFRLFIFYSNGRRSPGAGGQRGSFRPRPIEIPIDEAGGIHVSQN